MFIGPVVGGALCTAFSWRAMFLILACASAVLIVCALTVIETGGHNAFEAGLVLFPGALAALVFEPGAGMATDRFGARKVAIFGGCFLVVGALLCSIVPSDALLWLMALGQTLRCVGLTTLIPTTTSWGLGSLGKAGLTTHGSAGIIMSRQIAASLATAVMVFLIGCFPLSGEFMGFHAALGCLFVVIAKIPRSNRGANS